MFCLLLFTHTGSADTVVPIQAPSALRLLQLTKSVSSVMSRHLTPDWIYVQPRQRLNNFPQVQTSVEPDKVLKLHSWLDRICKANTTVSSFVFQAVLLCHLWLNVITVEQCTRVIKCNTCEGFDLCLTAASILNPVQYGVTHELSGPNPSTNPPTKRNGEKKKRFCGCLLIQ